ncbi:MAG: site-specific DNA-methyltransferase [Pirellulaceae bacterium]
MPISEIKPYANNPRKHSKRQIKLLADSLREIGFRRPLVVDRDGVLVVGHGLLEAAKYLGYETVPVVRCDDLTPEQIRKYRIFDNRIAELAEWDTPRLAVELQGLIELDYNLDLTGFEPAEIDNILRLGDEETEADEADEIPEPDEARPAVSRVGDLWHLGDHCLCCGDARDPAAYKAVLGTKKAQMVITDPPYNVHVPGHVSGQGKTKHPDFLMGSGEMKPKAFTEFLNVTTALLTSHSVNGSIHFIFMDFRHTSELLEATRPVYGAPLNLAVWTKTNGGMGSLYRSMHELVFVFKNGKTRHINNVALGKYGRYRTNVWHYPGMNSFGKHRDEQLAMHPTVKPVALVADAILDVSTRRGLVLDPFAGSGTTIIAAERTGRRAAAIELDPVYVDVAIRRFQKHTDKTVTLAETGQTFDEVAATRRKKSEAA